MNGNLLTFLMLEVTIWLFMLRKKDKLLFTILQTVSSACIQVNSRSIKFTKLRVLIMTLHKRSSISCSRTKSTINLMATWWFWTWKRSKTPCRWLTSTRLLRNYIWHMRSLCTTKTKTIFSDLPNYKFKMNLILKLNLLRCITAEVLSAGS